MKTFLVSPIIRNNGRGGEETEAQDSFNDVVRRFVGNFKGSLYKTFVQLMLAAYEAQ